MTDPPGSDLEIARFEIELPQLPTGRRRPRVLHNALRASASADYLKADLSRTGELVLATQVPAEVLTPAVEEGVRRGLEAFATMTARDMSRSRAWMERVERCLVEQAASFSLSFDWDDVWEAIPRLLEDGGFAPTSLGVDFRGRIRVKREIGFAPEDDLSFAAALEPAIASAEPGSLTPFDPDDVQQVVVHPARSGVSFISRVGAGRWKRKGEKLRRLLALNASADVARLGLDEYDGVVILYQTPGLTVDIVRHARQQLAVAWAGVLAIRQSD